MKVIAVAIATLLLMPVFAIAAMGQTFAVPEQDVSVNSRSLVEPIRGVEGDFVGRVLGHPRIHLTAGARHDVEAGRADPRILEILLALAELHELGRVGPIATGHSYFVKGTTRVSNHVSGRAVDISVIDGAPVSLSNGGAYRAAQTIASLAPPFRPDELGAPWRIAASGVYSLTENHSDHLHAGFDSPAKGDD
ncbi:MAG: hypothetical protein WD627_00815 [Actinomycetota bacterium]